MREAMINPTLALTRRVERLEEDVKRLLDDHYSPVGLTEVARVLGTSRQHLYQLIAKGGTPEPIETEPNRYDLEEWVTWYEGRTK